MSSTPMLEIEALVVSYDEVEAVHGISLQVKDGEIVTLIGANGAGKTTTLKAIAGQVKPRSGVIRFCGRSLDGLAPDAIVATGIAQVPEGRHIFPELTVEENLKVGGHLLTERGRLKTALGAVYEVFPPQRARWLQLGRTFERRRAADARARPRDDVAAASAVLDEPSLGLAPRLVSEVARAVRAFRAAGMTLLLVEQNAALALSLADRGYVIERRPRHCRKLGRELADGIPRS